VAINQIGGQGGQAIIGTLSPTEIDYGIPAFDVAIFPQAFSKRRHVGRICVRDPIVEKSNYRQRRLLCACWKRPCRRQNGSSFDEIASSHIAPQGVETDGAPKSDYSKGWRSE
jgi:hypothetical protein